MRSLLKLSIIFICILLSFAIIFISLKGGDILIYYLANCLGFKIDYINRCGFTSAFIFKTANLKSPLLQAAGNPLRIKCENAIISFDYSKFLEKRAIGLHCQFSKPIFLSESISQEEVSAFIDYVPTAIFSMLGETTGFQYDNIFCDLLMYGDAAEILHFTANSKKIIVKAKGSATNNGPIDIDLEALFSPEFIADFSEEAKFLLEEKSGGWMSFHIRIKTDTQTPFIKLESDRFRLSIKEVESQMKP